MYRPHVCHQPPPLVHAVLPQPALPTSRGQAPGVPPAPSLVHAVVPHSLLALLLRGLPVPASGPLLCPSSQLSDTMSPQRPCSPPCPPSPIPPPALMPLWPSFDASVLEQRSRPHRVPRAWHAPAHRQTCPSPRVPNGQMNTREASQMRSLWLSEVQ